MFGLFKPKPTYKINRHGDGTYSVEKITGGWDFGYYSAVIEDVKTYSECLSFINKDKHEDYGNSVIDTQYHD